MQRSEFDYYTYYSARHADDVKVGNTVTVQRPVKADMAPSVELKPRSVGTVTMLESSRKQDGNGLVYIRFVDADGKRRQAVTPRRNVRLA